VLSERIEHLALLSEKLLSWKGTLTQYAGRLGRTYSGKTEIRIYDYVDEGVPVL
jgi:superfamily II DNA or RNA helicase